MDAGKTAMVFDLRGTLIIEHPWPNPAPKASATVAKLDPARPSSVRDVLIHQLSEMS